MFRPRREIRGTRGLPDRREQEEQEEHGLLSGMGSIIFAICETRKNWIDIEMNKMMENKMDRCVLIRMVRNIGIDLMPAR